MRVPFEWRSHHICFKKWFFVHLLQKAMYWFAVFFTCMDNAFVNKSREKSFKRIPQKNKLICILRNFLGWSTGQSPWSAILQDAKKSFPLFSSNFFNGAKLDRITSGTDIWSRLPTPQAIEWHMSHHGLKPPRITRFRCILTTCFDVLVLATASAQPSKSRVECPLHNGFSHRRSLKRLPFPLGFNVVKLR